jgi:hypothetical protein
MCFSHFPQVCYIPSPSHSSWEKKLNFRNGLRVRSEINEATQLETKDMIRCCLVESHFMCWRYAYRAMVKWWLTGDNRTSTRSKMCSSASSSTTTRSQLLTARDMTPLSPWSWVFLEKLPAARLLNNFLIFYGTWRFITLFVSLSWARLTQYMPP